MKKIYVLLVLLLLAACQEEGEVTPEPTTTPSVTPIPLALRMVRDPSGPVCHAYAPPETVGVDIVFRCLADTPTAVSPTNIPTAVPNTPTSTPAPVDPYAGAPECPPEAHDLRAWHGLWDAELGCHYTHEHHADPHVLDTLFGTQVYDWMGGEISHPWQTFSGALDQFEQHHEGSCYENDCKHQGYKWLVIVGRGCPQTPYVMTGANNCITDARVLLHMVFSEQDALVRFHSVVVEARVCEFGEANCGIYRGAGHLDTGKLNIPRGIYIPLVYNHEPLAWLDETAEAQPYRIHGAPGGNPLDSWNTEGNQYNYLVLDPEGDLRLRVGVGVHVRDGWGGVSPEDPDIPLDCPDFQCDQNNSEAAMFRVWVTIPDALDGSQYDEDGAVDGFFSGYGYTNRYGDIVEGCAETSLDCIPFESQAVPVGRSRFRGELSNTNVDYDISPFWQNGTRDWWIEYPN